MRRGVGTAVLVAGVLVLAGCSAAPGTSRGSAATDPSSTGSPPPSSSPSSPSSPSAGDPRPEAEVPECATDVAEAIDRTVAAQLAALAAGDFRAAFAFASESFRSATDVQGFREVILTGYPEVAAATGHRLVECRQQGPSSAAALVDVTGDNGVTARLAYRVVLEPAGWRIDGASTLGTQAVPRA